MFLIFYAGDSNRPTSCEAHQITRSKARSACFGGSNPPGSSNFPDKARQTQHMEIFCYKHYEKCEVFRMVMDAKYHDEK